MNFSCELLPFANLELFFKAGLVVEETKDDLNPEGVMAFLPSDAIVLFGTKVNSCMFRSSSISS